MSKKSLHELGLEYNTDKAYLHNYCNFYAEHLEKYRDDKLKILEIGIFGGSSLRMWRDYFHNATIYGIDINPNSMFEEERIRTFVQDQGDEKSLLEFVEQHGPFDIVIDDGSHYTDHLDISYRLFKDSPIFIWEDICVCNFHLSNYKHYDRGPNKEGKYPLEIAKKLAETQDNCYLFDNNNTGYSITFIINNREKN